LSDNQEMARSPVAPLALASNAAQKGFTFPVAGLEEAVGVASWECEMGLF
jgi:hypothetical protein